MAVYACSDIHGQDELFKSMLERIGFCDKDTLYILGDMIDRGPGSIEVLDIAMGHKNIIPILGNHEMMMLDHLGRVKARDFWLNQSNGGRETKKKFLELDSEKQEDIIKYLKDTYLQVEIKIEETTFLLSHSSFLKDCGTVKWREIPSETAFDVVWDSPWRLWEYFGIDNYREDKRTHVIGHVPCQAFKHNDKRHVYINRKNNVINIDMGCAYIESEKELEKGFGLCFMDLTKYAEGDIKNAFLYEPKQYH